MAKQDKAFEKAEIRAEIARNERERCFGDVRELKTKLALAIERLEKAQRACEDAEDEVERLDP